MKHLNTFEANKYSRKQEYSYIDKENSDKIEIFVREFVKNTIVNKIENLEYIDFQNENFDYRRVFDNFLTSKYYESKNVYWEVDRYCMDNDLHFKTPALRNSLYDILNKIYKEYITSGMKIKLDEKLIELLELEPDKYEKRYKSYKKELTVAVKKACEWMLSYKKYNI